MISFVCSPSKMFSIVLFDMISIKLLPNSMVSCWNVFLNYGEDTFFIVSGLIADLFDFVS
jgi:hypothetical protein